MNNRKKKKSDDNTARKLNLITAILNLVIAFYC